MNDSQRTDQRTRADRPARVAIAGGGIAGMALALSLHDAGFDDVDVYESAPSVKELGVGINVLPHATRELAELGLLDALESVAIPTAELAYYTRHGQRVWREPRGRAAGYRWPQLSIHRGTLLGVLHRAVIDFLDGVALIDGASAIYQYPMVDRDPLPSWSFGRVTLLGDAAHPMYPIGSNGASQAILDARVLARELARQPSIEEAIAAYDAERRRETAGVVLANREGGPERCVGIVEQRAPDGFAELEDVISREELEEIAQSYKRTAGFEPEALNNRPSLSVGRRSADRAGRRGHGHEPVHA